MKKQIITVIAVALVAVLLFTTYAVFLKDDGIEEVDDPFYVLTSDAVKALEDVGKGKIVLHGYDSLNDNWILLKRFAGVVATAADFKLLEEKNPEFNGVEIIYGDSAKRIEFKDFFKYLYDGTPYAFDGESLLVNSILSLAGKTELSFELRALSGYDINGNMVTANGAPFMFPSVNRDNIDILSISVREDKNTSEDTSSDVTDESTDESTNESADESTDESTDESINESEISVAAEESSETTSDDTSDKEEVKEEVKEETKEETEKDDDFRTYSIYQMDGKFYFDKSIAIKYNEEKFAQVTTNCRYTVTQGAMKMPEGRTWADYGLDHENPTTAKYTLMTTKDKDGNYIIHTVFIGNKASNGVQYYARYVGGMYKSEGEDRELVHNFTKELVFFLSSSVVEESICLPDTDLMEPTIVTPITATEALFSFDDIRIEYADKGIMALAKNLSEFNPADNLSAIDADSISKVICDKKNADDYSAYSNGWQQHLGVFAGFSSSDGKKTHIDAAITRKVENGNFEVRFGLLRDEVNGAYLPSKVTLKISTDGINWDSIDNGEVSPAQKDKTINRYTVNFHSDKNVKYIRIGFDVPQVAKTYVVFDEVRIFGDGDDAQPAAAIGGRWKLVTPSSYIPANRNYEYLDMTNFNEFVQDMGSLAGARVVGCAFSDNGNAVSTLLKTDILAKFGLAKPARHYSYTYDSIVVDIYVSAKDEKTGKYYAYATYSGESEGKYQVVTSDVIVELSETEYPWLSWEFVEFLDHSLISMYLVDIPQMEISFDGTEYKFELGLDSERSLNSVVYNGQSFDVTSFKYLYQHMLGIKMYDVYTPTEGDQEPVEYLRIKVHSESSSPEFVFYRVSATRCYFTVNGVGSYYALVDNVETVRKDVLNYIAGGTITK